ncbi:hypothetical protein, partial [Burkholderia gladioli]|uniref:hypothetical protein n=1 Tax=Burkholderia gladioli TaxID=28095 RepID=UPI003C7C62D1
MPLTFIPIVDDPYCVIVPPWFDRLAPVSVMLPPLDTLPWSLIIVPEAFALTVPCALVVALDRFTSPAVAFSDRLPFAV